MNTFELFTVREVFNRNTSRNGYLRKSYGLFKANSHAQAKQKFAALYGHLDRTSKVVSKEVR